MEGLVIFAIILFFFKAIAKRSKEITDARKAGDAGKPGTVEQHPTVHRYPPVRPVQPQPPVSQPNTAAEGSSNYQVLQPTVQVGRKRDDYVGSLGPVSKEGSASEEGKDNCDPSLAHDRIPLTALDTVPDIEESPIEVLPHVWEGSALVQSVVLSEILDRPHGWSRKHG